MNGLWSQATQQLFDTSNYDMKLRSRFIYCVPLTRFILCSVDEVYILCSVDEVYIFCSVDNSFLPRPLMCLDRLIK